jgi:RNA polymerase sigma-54 factor
MKQALQFRLGQSLTMTPQLQQAIRLLQLSTLELNTEIQDALDSNMMLEIGDDSENNENENTSSTEKNTQISAENNDVSQNESSETSSENTLETIADTPSPDLMPDDLPVDTSWDDIYDSILPGITTSAATTSYTADEQPEVYTASTESLHERLRWQIKMTPFSEVDAAIAEVIIDEINDDGFLQTSVEEMTTTLGTLEIHEVEIDEVEAVLHQIHNFDPAGVGARDLRESLSIQLHRQTNDVDLREYAITLVDNYFDLLANRCE